jgi:pyruvate/2-oxoglutarate dehydrogenase complex dihydrolipoamide dehydrogenase (E3) component
VVDDRADVVVLGMGPGGEELAGKLAAAGLDVVGIDERLVGGECPYWGCVPSKMMIRAANLLTEGRRIPGMAGDATVRPEWTPVARRIREDATDNWDDRVAVERFVGKGGRFIRGHGDIEAPNRVRVGDRTITAGRALVINTGTEAVIPPIPGLRDVPYWINRDAIETESVPASLTVLGGGAIGLELAQVFARFGAKVTIVEATDRLLPPEEPEASALIAKVLEREGLSAQTGVAAQQAASEGGHIVLTLADGSKVGSEKLLVATGRRANLRAFHAENAGIPSDAHCIQVDGTMRAAPGVWAIGDATGEGAFTHVSMFQAAIAIDDILGKHPEPADYRAVPRVTFTDPEIGSVGLSEAQARERGLMVRTGTSQVPSSARGWIHKAGNDGFIKLIEDADRGVLVGATSAGPVGGEVLSMLTLAVHAQTPVATLRRMIYAYPTFHRGVEDALRALQAA